MSGPSLPPDPAGVPPESRHHELDDSAAILDNVGSELPFTFNHEYWERLRREQLGINVIDRTGYDIGMSVAGDKAPFHRLKQVLVGELDHFYIYEGDGAEWDWNFCLAPDPTFRHILDDVIDKMWEEDQADAQFPFRVSDLVKRKNGPGLCVECEVTPDEELRNSEFLRGIPLPGHGYFTILYGQRIGVYGPWIRDHYHGGRPEIHPCETIWWMAPRNPPGVSTSRYILVLQDASNRFSLDVHFRPPHPRPWAASPRNVHITTALRPIVQNHMRFDLKLLDGREMDRMPDAGDVSLTGQFDGEPVITVSKRTERPDRIGMKLSPIVRDPDGTHLRCFLYLSVMVGRGSEGPNGYALLNLETLA